MKLDRPTVELLAAIFHSVYQEEAKKQGNIKYPDDYNDLPENIKDFDRALARYVLKNFAFYAELKQWKK